VKYLSFTSWKAGKSLARYILLSSIMAGNVTTSGEASVSRDANGRGTGRIPYLPKEIKIELYMQNLPRRVALVHNFVDTPGSSVESIAFIPEDNGEIHNIQTSNAVARRMAANGYRIRFQGQTLETSSGRKGTYFSNDRDTLLFYNWLDEGHRMVELLP
jgi:hypothetical protein